MDNKARENIEEKKEKNLLSIYENEKNLAREPFFFKGTNGRGVLLVHGWTSAPYETRKLGEFLHSKGYTVLGILLSGHGTKPEDLEGVRWEKWIDDISSGYEKLRRNCKRIYLGGTSIGGTLGIIFAEKNPEISGLILMATPYKLKMEWLVSFVSRTSLLLGKRYWKKYYPKSFGSSGLITRMVAYQKYPTFTGIEAHKAIRVARKNLSKISCPCFILQSTHDHIVKLDSIEMIYDKISSSVKKKRYVQKAYHTFIADLNNDHIFEDIREFLDQN